MRERPRVGSRLGPNPSLHFDRGATPIDEPVIGTPLRPPGGLPVILLDGRYPAIEQSREEVDGVCVAPASHILDVAVPSINLRLAPNRTRVGTFSQLEEGR